MTCFGPLGESAQQVLEGSIGGELTSAQEVPRELPHHGSDEYLE
jgi:hypothetical protein